MPTRVTRILTFFGPLALLALIPSDLSAQAEAVLDSGDTAWILTSTALVLFMTIPGLSLFYAGLVRERNVLSVLMHCFAITCLMSVLWVTVGYSLAFATSGMEEGVRNLSSFVGGFGAVFLKGMTGSSMSGSIPQVLFVGFQMTFYIITPALIVGAFVERMKFSSMLWFVALWSLFVYAPICHMVWGGPGSFLGDMGVFDFAGGIVVHITAGFAALVACIMIGVRTGYPNTPMAPHSLPLTVMGAGMLWVGWFGFNAGSALAANGDAAMALLVTNTSAATASLAWMACEWIIHRKPSVLGIVTGAIAGLAAITPASGFVGPIGALCIGAVSGFVCWFVSTRIKMKLGYDDSLDVFGVHGIGGVVGTMGVALFASVRFGGNQGPLDISKQIGIQAFGVIVAIVYTLILTAVILKIIDLAIGLRVPEEDENEGLDQSAHGETGYSSD